MDKRYIKREGKTHFVMMERNIMSKAVHPNIVRLIYTFQDNYNLYMVSDLCKGGELRHIINYYRDINRQQYIEQQQQQQQISESSVSSSSTSITEDIPTNLVSQNSFSTASFSSLNSNPPPTK